MIIIIIMTALVVIGVILAIISNRKDRVELATVSVTATILLGIAIIACVLCIICENSMQDMKVMEWQKRRESIVYQMEHGLYLGDSLGEFNQELVRKKTYNRSPWTNWFEGEYVEEIELIDTK